LEEADLKSPQAIIQWEKAKETLKHAYGSCLAVFDTVGALSILNDQAVSACSSGGILLKSPGRIGHVFILICIFYWIHS
jgi:isoaspartyl peptidase/L-asparaginase-like protein (Ntn-hydrolase superfamily)